VWCRDNFPAAPYSIWSDFFVAGLIQPELIQFHRVIKKCGVCFVTAYSISKINKRQTFKNLINSTENL